MIELNQVDSEATEKFLSQKLLEYTSELEASEARLMVFKRQNVGMLPGEATTTSGSSKV